LPDLSLNYTYGIDAPQFAAHALDGSRNLGYSASATLDIPIWDWFVTHDRVRQSEYSRTAAHAVLTNTQRKLIATLEENYAEAVAAHDQLDSLNLSASTAAESLRLTRLRYTSGEATILEVVDAENSLTTSELAREDGLVRYQAALANLQLLTGTL
jgi:outer membrane protein TolC